MKLREVVVRELTKPEDFVATSNDEQNVNQGAAIPCAGKTVGELQELIERLSNKGRGCCGRRDCMIQLLAALGGPARRNLIQSLDRQALLEILEESCFSLKPKG